MTLLTPQYKNPQGDNNRQLYLWAQDLIKQLRKGPGAQGPINDTSSVIGSNASYWNPTYSGNTGYGLVWRFNRVKVGTAALSGSDLPQTSPDWLESLGLVAGINGFSGEGQLTSISTIGCFGIGGASRTSDYTTAFGGSSPGSEGVIGFAYNDGSGIAAGVLGLGFRKIGVSGVTLGTQLDCCNGGAVVDVTPFTALTGGMTIAALITPGAYTTLAAHNASAQLVIGGGATGIFGRKGVVFLSNALDTAVGGSGQGVAIEFARSQSLRWLNSTPATDLEMWANASGLVINTYPFLTTSAPGAATPYNIIDDSAGNNALILGGGGSTPDHSNYYRNTSHNFADIGGANYSHFLNSAGAYINSGLAIAAGGSAGIGIRLSSTVNFGIFYGSGAPTLSAAQGSLYLRSDGVVNNRLYINTNGSTGWTAFQTTT